MINRCSRSRVLLAFGLLGSLAGCSSANESAPVDMLAPDAPHAGEMSVDQPTAGTDGHSGPGDGTGGSGPAIGGAGSAASSGGSSLGEGPARDCESEGPFKVQGCPCRPGETAACWTGSAADRNVGDCHDGLQVCDPTGDEFSAWGECMGEQLDCGEEPDAGVPPPPPPPGDCPCVPGAIIQCSEDCSVAIICSLTASKTCLPDGTWSVCHEDLSVALDLPGFQCRNMFHGCLNDPESDFSGQGEAFVGDCSKQFSCGEAPSFLPIPPVDDAAN